jgi:hypothetical protein
VPDLTRPRPREERNQLIRRRGYLAFVWAVPSQAYRARLTEPRQI